MSERRPSPRSRELPMAFTMWEFIRGCLLTYAFFLGFSALAWIWTIVGAFFAPIYVAPYGFASLVLCGAPLAYLTGMLLRRETRTVVHLIWHGTVGLCAGAFGVLVFLCIENGGILTFGPPHLPTWDILTGGWIFAVVEAAATVVAAMAGWRVTSRRALQSDPWWIDPNVRDRRDEDERVEDAAVES